MKKQMGAALLALVLAISLLPVGALAAVGSSFTAGNLTYTVLTEDATGGTVAVTGYVDNGDTDLVFLEEVTDAATTKTYQVTEIGASAFLMNTTITSVDFSEAKKLRSIGDKAFFACANLTGDLNLSGLTALESIGIQAFYQCQELTGDLNLSGLPALTSIGESAFSLCNKLTGELDLTASTNLESIGNGAFWGCGLTGVNLSGLSALESIGMSAFSDCRELTSVNLTGLTALESIGGQAFSGCKGLTGAFDLSGLSALTTLGDYTFGGCEGLTSVSLPAGVTAIPKGFFKNCTGLASLQFASMTAPSVSTEVFDGLPATGVVTYPKGGTGYLAASFPGLGAGWTFGEDTSMVGSSFSDGNLTYTVLTEDATGGTVAVTGYVDNGDTDLVFLEEVTDAATTKTYQVTEIGAGAFQSNGTITSVDFAGAKKLRSIGARAFSGCINLTGGLDLTGLMALTSIGSDAFFGCNKLTSVNLTGLTALESIGNGAFWGCGLTGVNLSGLSALESIGSDAFFGCNKLTSVNLSGLTALESIGKSAFSGCKGLTGAFDLSGLSALTTLGDYTFSGCEGLTSVSLPAGITAIPKGFFKNCKGLASLQFASMTAPSVNPAEVFDGLPATGIVTYPKGGTGYLAANFTGLGAGWTFVEFVPPVEEEEEDNNNRGGSGSGDDAPGYYSLTLTDKATGLVLSGSQIHENARLSVKPYSLGNQEGAQFDWLRALQEQKHLLQSYDVSLSQGFRGEIAVSFSVDRAYDGKSMMVVHLEKDKALAYPVTVKEGRASVTLRSLSPLLLLDGVYATDAAAVAAVIGTAGAGAGAGAGATAVAAPNPSTGADLFSGGV